MWRALLRASLLHLAVFGLGVSFFGKIPSQVLPTRTEFRVDLIPGRVAPQHPPIVSSRRRPLPPLSRLGLSPIAPPGAGKTSSAPASKLQRDAALWGNGPDETPNWAEEGAATPLLTALYERIDRQLPYPDELIDAGKSGEVLTELTIAPDGRMAGGFGKTLAEDPYLKVHVFRVIRRALSEPLLIARGNGRNLRVLAHFKFLVTYDRSLRPDGAMGRQRNYLSFERVAIRPFSSHTAFGESRKSNAALAPGEGRFWGAIKIDEDGIFSIAITPNGMGIGPDFIPLIRKLFEKPKLKGYDPLERYRMDPDF